MSSVDAASGVTDSDIAVVGTGEIEAIDSFDAMGLSEPLLRGIYAYGACILVAPLAIAHLQPQAPPGSWGGSSGGGWWSLVVAAFPGCPALKTATRTQASRSRPLSSSGPSSRS